ncbi:MAG: bifunctional oligoribonuclease/PAP phosphatase NrnA [Desulfuromonadales bacterium]|nr:bifunctional oligoribonuclease/PAP phosphatase NrnA [Desulfuromonadales bacterium]
MIAAIVQQIEQGNSFLIASHGSPDGDAIGSTLALALALQQMGKEVVALNVDGVPETFAFLPGADKLVTGIEATRQFDVGFVLDAGELRRAGVPVEDHCKTLINIDHHPHSDFGDICYLDTSASATAALIYRILKACGFPLCLDIATSLYTAILSDTGSFRYSNADPEAFAIAGELVELGIDTWEIASRLYESQPAQRMMLLARVLPTLDISGCGKFASVTMSTEMLEAAGARAEDTDGFVNYPRAIQGVEVAVFFRQISQEQTKVGFRSRGAVDVGEFARKLGGGGHHNAAGVTIDGPLEEVRLAVLRLLERHFASA